MSDGKIIYLDDALDALEKVARLFPYRIPGNRDTYDRYNEAWNDAIGRAEIEIEELPPAQPEIIHCRECKHHIDGFFCQKANHHTSDMDYCASVFGAERREE